jgi:hypothetical protein
MDIKRSGSQPEAQAKATVEEAVKRFGRIACGGGLNAK